MKYSELLIPTLREAPADAEVVSHQLMLRAGYIRKLASGVYSYLPLCLRVIRKIEKIVREEMESSGAHELLLPIVMPAELWTESGRWDRYGPELLRFKDRHEREFCIGPTHEEAITDLIRHEIKSYRDLPKNCFQIQTKFRDEVRPRFGLMRGREFIMKDGYSFDRDEENALKTYELMYDAYKRIFTRCGLAFRPVEAMTGAIGGSRSHEFQVLADSGEDAIVACDQCEYAANVEKAEIQSSSDDVHQTSAIKGKFRKVPTPGKKTADEVGPVVRLLPQQITKTLVFETDKGLMIGMVRADHQLVEEKFKQATGVEWCHLAHEDAVLKTIGAPVGYVGPIGVTIPVYADHALLAMENFLVGANEKDMHLVDVNLGDFNVTQFSDLRRAVAGDACPRCGGKYSEHRGIEVGQVFYLGTKYSEPMGAHFTDEAGKDQPMVMGCYGIGIGRTAAAAIEQNHDDRGIIWPMPIAPFHVEIIPLARDGEVFEVATKLAAECEDSNIEVLIDDRDVRAGVKFNDAELIGIPYQIVIGMKGLQEGVVEFKDRRTGMTEKIKRDDVLARMLTIFHQEGMS
ncbi:MAG: proline--tRNA ligase [Deltaproteobacteria bacterium]|nr:proline--tRNA ligase [Deltaproteobacteria bacterium]